MTERQRNYKIELLKAGQIVEIDGDWFQAVKAPDYWSFRTCELCDLDSLCQGNVAIICGELDKPLYSKYYLKLAHP